MTIVTVRAHALESDVKVTVEPGSAVLLGRQPDERTLRKQAPSFVPGEVAAVSIPCPQVSKNHALIRATGAAVSIQDLWSTHGTWLRLLPGVPVTMEAPAAIELELARAPVDPGDPKDSEWSQPADFPEVVREAVERWLDDADVIATAAIGAGDPEEGDAWAFALADGSHLKVTASPGRTIGLAPSAVLDTVRRYVHRQNALLLQEQGHGEDFILASPAFRRAHREVAEAASRGLRVVLIGPSGAGKEELAACYHLHSRPTGPFVPLSCANLVGDHGYLDLFGAAVKGDGYMAKAGAVEDANHGTLFLDELQDLRPRDQAHLLRFLNERRDARGNKVRGEFFRFGDKDRNRPRFASDVNLVCATLVDLDDERVRQEHGFREDLWNRIATRVVRVPPLSERPEDVHAFLETQPLDQEVKLMEALTLEAQKVALTHRWPGNFRALVNFRQQLPAKLSPGCVDAATCRRLLQASGRDGTPAPAAAVALHAGGTPALHSTGLDWAAINEEAARMFQNANGRPPGENQLVGYLNDYVKPVAIAHACGMQGERQIPRSLNLSGLARRLGFADGTTVRGHLERYLALF